MVLTVFNHFSDLIERIRQIHSASKLDRLSTHTDPVPALHQHSLTGVQKQLLETIGTRLPVSSETDIPNKSIDVAPDNERD